ncbi:MAG: hypothetical protein ACXADH_15555, partial [Candidatus Kariarchaeaceae archaeon]
MSQIYELFHKNYLSEDVLRKARVRVDAPEAEAQVRRYLDLRANASRYQVSKPLFGPGVLMNSIKSGVAVDYPIFTGSFSNVRDNLPTGSAITGSWPTGGDVLVPSSTTFTGSLINETVDLGIPRIKSAVNTRIDFEDLLNPSNIYNIDIFDNEPHPSASLQYGSRHWSRIIERPAKFGTFEDTTLLGDLGVDFSNNRKDFANQIAPYTLAMQNFAAETVNFFVEDGHLTTVMSKPIDEPFVSGSIHKMRVRLSNTNNVMYDRHSAFGPPVDDAGSGLELTKLTVSTDPMPSSASMTFVDPNNYTADLLNYSGSRNNLVNLKLNLGTINGYSGLGSGYDVRINFYRSSADFTTQPADAIGEGPIPIPGNGTEIINIDIDSITSGGTSEERAGEVASLVKQKLETTEGFPAAFLATVEGSSLTVTTKYNGETDGYFIFSGLEYDPDEDPVYIFSGSGTPNVLSGSTSSLTFSSGSTGEASYFTETTVASTSSHGFAPYVPPFLDPNSDPYVEIRFKASETKNYTAQEIIEDSTFTYYNFKEVPNNSSTNTNYKEAMSISASLNLGICASLRTDNIETLAAGQAFISDIEAPNGLEFQTDIKVDANKKLNRWVIQTKWETPVMDFSNVSASALNLSTGQEQIVSGSPWKTRYWDRYYTIGSPKHGVTSGSFMTGSVGMWHQKGEVLTNQATNGQKKGYYLVVEDVLDESGVQPLASKLGFVNYREENNTVKSLKKAKEYRTRV